MGGYDIRLAPLPWPPRSPDLTTPDNSLWVIIKGRVAARRYNNNKDLRRAVEDAFRKVTPKTLRHKSQRTSINMHIRIHWPRIQGVRKSFKWNYGSVLVGVRWLLAHPVQYCSEQIRYGAKITNIMKKLQNVLKQPFSKIILYITRHTASKQKCLYQARRQPQQQHSHYVYSRLWSAGRNLTTLQKHQLMSHTTLHIPPIITRQIYTNLLSASHSYIYYV